MSTRFNFENHPGYEKLKEAFSRSNRDFLNSIELVPEEDVYFSPQYEKKMAHLIKRQKRPYWKFVNTVGKKIAVIAIAFMMLFGLSMSIKAIRDPVISFIENVFEKFSELFVDKSETQNAPDKIEEVYTLSGLPDEYEEVLFYNTEILVKTVWSEGKNEISFSQSKLNSKITFDIESSETKRILLNNAEVFYNYKNQKTQIFWRNNFYMFIIEYSDFASENEMIELYESVVIRKDT